MEPRLILGDCLEVLPALESGSVDAIITDPPYSSGGFTRGDRTADPANKYCQNGNAVGRPSFSGDNRDQHSWGYWCSLWMGQCLRIVKPSGYLLSFTDWRQLPTATDAIQAGGWVWRGIVAWDKGRGARAPNPSYFRHQCEYVVWATAGVTKAYKNTGPWDGSYQIPTRQADKHHMTGKPVELMRRLAECCPEGGTVLDPFMGSGTTGVACRDTGRNFIGVEKDPAYFAIAEKRINEAHAEGRAA